MSTGDAGIILRSCKVSIVAVIRASNHAPPGTLPHVSRGHSPRTGDVDFSQSVSQFFALKPKPGSEVVQWETNGWVTGLTKMKM